MTDFRNLRDIVAGDDVSFTLRFRDDEGNPVNVAGDTVYLTLQADLAIEDEAMSIVHNIPDNEDAADGVIQVPVGNSDTDIPPGEYWYDFVWVKTSSDQGKRETILLGKITVRQGVTGV